MSQPKRGRICPTNLQRCELWSCHTSGECDMKKEASNPPSATREIEPIGEVMGHDQKGLALVQWHDNGLRPVGMQVYGANFTRSQSRPRLGPNESIGNPGTLPRDAYAPSSIVEPEKLRGEERRKYIHDHDCPTAWAFFNKHASGSKVCPSCLTCGQQVHDREEWGITHLELPDIYVCKPCVAKLRSTASAIEEPSPQYVGERTPPPEARPRECKEHEFDELCIFCGKSIHEWIKEEASSKPQNSISTKEKS